MPSNVMNGRLKWHAEWICKQADLACCVINARWVIWSIHKGVNSRTPPWTTHKKCIGLPASTGPGLGGIQLTFGFYRMSLITAFPLSTCCETNPTGTGTSGHDTNPFEQTKLLGVGTSYPNLNLFWNFNWIVRSRISVMSSKLAKIWPLIKHLYCCCF